MNFLITFFFFSSLSIISHAETHYLLDASLRTQPSAKNLVGTAAYDGMLWGVADKKNPLYGYYRVGLRAGGNPSYAAFLQIAPVAPLIFEIQRGDTHRFFDISSINCDLVECKGKVERTDYSIRLLAAYESIFFSGTALWRELRTSNNSKLVGLENELFVVTSGFHRYFESNITLGYQLPGEHLAGVTYTSGLLSEGDRKISTVYGFYQLPYKGFSVTLGAGEYKSDAPDQDGFSGVLLISKEWGEKLSLY